MFVVSDHATHTLVLTKIITTLDVRDANFPLHFPPRLLVAVDVLLRW